MEVRIAIIATSFYLLLLFEIYSFILFLFSLFSIGDVDASGEEDMVTMMDPSMFMDTMMTEDQSGEALDFGGGEGSEAESGSSPRKRALEGADENGSAAKRQDISGPVVAYPGMKPDQEMVAPDLMYPNSDQVCCICTSDSI